MDSSDESCPCGCLECSCQSSCVCTEDCDCMVCYGIRDCLCQICHKPLFLQTNATAAVGNLESCTCFFSNSNVNLLPEENVNYAAEAANANVLNNRMLVGNDQLSISDYQAAGDTGVEQMPLPSISIDTRLVPPRLESQEQSTVQSECHGSSSDPHMLDYDPYCTQSIQSSFQSKLSPNKLSPGTSKSSSHEPQSTADDSESSSESPPSSEESAENCTNSLRNAESAPHEGPSFEVEFKDAQRQNIETSPQLNQPSDPTVILSTHSACGAIAPFPRTFIPPPPPPPPPAMRPLVIPPQCRAISRSVDSGISSYARFSANPYLRASRPQPPEQRLFGLRSNIMGWIRTVDDPDRPSKSIDCANQSSSSSTKNDSDSSNEFNILRSPDNYLVTEVDSCSSYSEDLEESLSTERHRDVLLDSKSSSSTTGISESRAACAEASDIISSLNNVTVASVDKGDEDSDLRDTNVDKRTDTNVEESNATNTQSNCDMNIVTDDYAADPSSSDMNMES